jgi:hypothetical protein
MVDFLLKPLPIEPSKGDKLSSNNTTTTPTTTKVYTTRRTVSCPCGSLRGDRRQRRFPAEWRGTKLFGHGIRLWLVQYIYNRQHTRHCFRQGSPACEWSTHLSDIASRIHSVRLSIKHSRSSVHVWVRRLLTMQGLSRFTTLSLGTSFTRVPSRLKHNAKHVYSSGYELSPCFSCVNWGRSIILYTRKSGYACLPIGAECWLQAKSSYSPVGLWMPHVLQNTDKPNLPVMHGSLCNHPSGSVEYMCLGRPICLSSLQLCTEVKLWMFHHGEWC